MSSITIPETFPNTPMKISINNTTYTFTPGATVDVPAEVAAEITRLAAALTKEAPGVEPPWSGGGSGGGATIVHAALDAQANGSLDMTAGEILAAAEVGPVILCEIYPGYGTIAAGPVSIFLNPTGEFYISGISPNVSRYVAASADAYPSAGVSSDDDNPGSL